MQGFIYTCPSGAGAAGDSVVGRLIHQTRTKMDQECLRSL